MQNNFCSLIGGKVFSFYCAFSKVYQNTPNVCCFGAGEDIAFDAPLVRLVLDVLLERKPTLEWNHALINGDLAWQNIFF